MTPPPRDELVQRLLDNELAGSDRKAALRQILADPRTAAELAAANQAIGALRAAPRVPDLSARILAEAHRRRPYLPPAQRRWVTTTRAVAAGSLLLAFVGMAATKRAFPHLFDLSTQPDPIARVDHALRTDAAVSAQAVTTQVRRLHASLLPIDGSGTLASGAPRPTPASLAGRPTILLIDHADGRTTFHDTRGRPATPFDPALRAELTPIAPLAVTGGRRDDALPADAKLP